MWTTTETHTTTLGDTYMIQKQGKMWRGVIKRKDDKSERIQCTKSHAKFIVIEYMHLVNVCQQDALNGWNPYVSKEYAQAYKNL